MHFSLLSFFGSAFAPRRFDSLINRVRECVVSFLKVEGQGHYVFIRLSLIYSLFSLSFSYLATRFLFRVCRNNNTKK